MKKFVIYKKKKVEELFDMDGDMLDDDDLENEKGVMFGEGEDDSVMGSKSLIKMIVR